MADLPSCNSGEVNLSKEESARSIKSGTAKMQTVFQAARQSDPNSGPVPGKNCYTPAVKIDKELK